MSEVNADGLLLNPEEALLQEVQHLSNALMAEEPRHLEWYQSQDERVTAANGEPAGQVGGQHMPPNLAARHEAAERWAVRKKGK